MQADISYSMRYEYTVLLSEAMILEPDHFPYENDIHLSFPMTPNSRGRGLRRWKSPCFIFGHVSRNPVNP